MRDAAFLVDAQLSHGVPVTGGDAEASMLDDQGASILFRGVGGGEPRHLHNVVRLYFEPFSTQAPHPHSEPAKNEFHLPKLVGVRRGEADAPFNFFVHSTLAYRPLLSISATCLVTSRTSPGPTSPPYPSRRAAYAFEATSECAPVSVSFASLRSTARSSSLVVRIANPKSIRVSSLSLLLSSSLSRRTFDVVRSPCMIPDA